MNIELRKFTFSERMSEETNCFAADVYIDGKKAAEAKNDGHGGPTYYHAYPGCEALVKKAEDFCKAMPPYVFPKEEGDTAEPMTIPMDLEFFIDNLVEEQLKLKDKKKFEKKFEKSIIWGVPGANSYKEVKFKVLLSQIPTAKLQEYVDNYRKKFNPGEEFLNTNFEALNIRP